jgi:hypothetical protein
MCLYVPFESFQLLNYFLKIRSKYRGMIIIFVTYDSLHTFKNESIADITVF